MELIKVKLLEFKLNVLITLLPIFQFNLSPNRQLTDRKLLLIHLGQLYKTGLTGKMSQRDAFVLSLPTYVDLYIDNARISLLSH